MTYYKNSGLGDAIASEMVKVMESDEHKALFQKKASVKKEAQDPMKDFNATDASNFGTGGTPTVTEDMAKNMAGSGGSQTAAKGTPGAPGSSLTQKHDPTKGTPLGVSTNESVKDPMARKVPGPSLTTTTPTGAPINAPAPKAASEMIENIIRVAEYCDENDMRMSEKYATRLLQSIIVEAKKSKKCKECGEKVADCKCKEDKKKDKK